MATTTATLTLSSTDLTGDALALSTTATLTKGGNVTGLDQTTGVARKYYSGTTADVLVDETISSATDPGHKVYVRNPSTDAAEYFTLSLGDALATTEIGRLYAGDWTLLPYSAASALDLMITPSAAGMTVEYMVIYHS